MADEDEKNQQRIRIIKSKLVEHVSKVISEFCRKRDLHDSEFFVSGLILKIAIDSAVLDLERMASFHIPPDKSPDRHKYAGFVTKWIAKCRPIQFKKDIPVNLKSADSLWVNADLAVHIFSSFLNAPIPDALAKNLRYWFMFREERGETLALIAHCCESIADSAAKLADKK